MFPDPWREKIFSTAVGASMWDGSILYRDQAERVVSTQGAFLLRDWGQTSGACRLCFPVDAAPIPRKP